MFRPLQVGGKRQSGPQFRLQVGGDDDFRNRTMGQVGAESSESLFSDRLLNAAHVRGGASDVSEWSAPAEAFAPAARYTLRPASNFFGEVSPGGPQRSWPCRLTTEYRNQACATTAHPYRVWRLRHGDLSGRLQNLRRSVTKLW